MTVSRTVRLGAALAAAALALTACAGGPTAPETADGSAKIRFTWWGNPARAEATRAIVAEELAKVLILTTFDRDDYVFDGLQAGASGFLLKNAGPEQLVDALRAVAEGHALLAPEVTRRVIAAMSDSTPRAATGRTTGEQEALARLTDREREVLTLVARGLSNSEIAKELFLGEATVKTHVSNTLAKLHLRDRVQAVVFAYENGLTQS